MTIPSSALASIPLPVHADWTGIVVLVGLGLIICALLIGVVVRIERSEGLEDDLDRD
ncbi:MAG TPA: hypothetical protein PKB10_04895 [Tepidisphaeraceae bacterium]|nr:hypothetical protein [Tepidisphaeraceae bacterium]